MDEATVDIADVYADAYTVPACDVTPGLWVFDVMGGRHQVTAVRKHTTSPRMVVITRDDGVQTPLYLDETITVATGGNA